MSNKSSRSDKGKPRPKVQPQDPKVIPSQIETLCRTVHAVANAAFPGTILNVEHYPLTSGENVVILKMNLAGSREPAEAPPAQQQQPTESLHEAPEAKYEAAAEQEASMSDGSE